MNLTLDKDMDAKVQRLFWECDMVSEVIQQGPHSKGCAVGQQV